jgi:hypothetical protein
VGRGYSAPERDFTGGDPVPGSTHGIRSGLRLAVAGLAVAGLAVAGGPAASAATTPYRVQQTPRINGLLASVSCAGTRFCAAATSSSLPPLAPVPRGVPSVLVRTAAGGPWRIPRGAAIGLVTGLSCTSATFCLAIGTTGAHRWDGSRWTAVAAPPGPATTPLGSGEQKVSCVSRTFCLAVGLTDGPHPGPAAAVWNGTSWQSTAAPKTPSGASSVKLDGVSCPKKTVCFANGKYRKGGLGFTLVEGFRGSTWVISGPATRLSPVSASMDLSCASTTACMAVWGDYNGGGRARWWNGSTWKGTTLAGPSGAHFARGILSVSCAAATSCTAVGALISGDPRKPAPLIEHWDGRAWTRTASALPASGHAALGGVSCTAAQVCTAVGFRQPGAAPFAEARRS